MGKERDRRKAHQREGFWEQRGVAANGATIGPCPKCGANERHFAPPSLGEPGFYICQPR
jgi:hypothetical protein